MIKFFVASFCSSLSECVVLCLVGGATVSSVWHLVLEIGLQEKSLLFYLLFVGISVPVIWFSLFWIKVLLVPNSRGKLSIFSPLPTTSCQISIRNDDLIPVIAGSWLTVWLFMVTIGWSMAIRHEPILYKTGHRVTIFPKTCPKHGNEFEDWFKRVYLPNIKTIQKLPIGKRKFLVFQPTASLDFDEKISGLMTSFVLAVVLNRELLVDWSHEMNEILESPGWEWDYSRLFPKKPMTPTILDLVTRPSYIVPPSHSWSWADLLQANLTEVMSYNNIVMIIDCDEFVAPLLWLNPVYKSFFCGLCDVQDIYTSLAKVLLNWTPKLEAMATAARSVVKDGVIMIADSTITTRQRLRAMTDTMMRCADRIDPKKNQWLIVRNGGGLTEFPAWPEIGPHQVVYQEALPEVDPLKKDLAAAVLFKLAQKSRAVVGFTGSSLAESIAFSAGIPLYVVMHRTPFCGEVTIRLPCIYKWRAILNSPRVNMSSFMSAEMTNMIKCKV